MGIVNTLSKLKAIERERVIYSIKYRKAGVCFTFDEAIPEDDWRNQLVTYEYYPSFEKAVNGEYSRICLEKAGK